MYRAKLNKATMGKPYFPHTTKPKWKPEGIQTTITMLSMKPYRLGYLKRKNSENAQNQTKDHPKTQTQKLAIPKPNVATKTKHKNKTPKTSTV